MAKPKSRDAEATKGAILRAAREQFAAHGFERATVRAIAGGAGVDAALVIRYFGSKDKLFAAAADFDLRLPILTALPRARVGEALLLHFIDRWEADDTFAALLRSAATNELAARRVRAVLAKQVTPAVAAVACDGQGATRAALVAAQILGLGLCRYVLRLPPLVGLSRTQLAKACAPTLQRYLAGPLD
jgi:AcrR family transcriptional regulator